MALPKTFTGGERLFADDLNDNFEALDTRLATAEFDIDNVGPEFAIAGSDSVNIDLSKDRVITRTAAGDVTFSGSNYTAGRSASVRIVPGGSSRALTFPAGWKFVSFKPTSIAANKTGVLAVTAFGNGESDAVAAWAVES
jgi:hypothetical protein